MKCARCGSETSIMWWAYEFACEEFCFCDKCQASFVEWLREGEE